MGKNMWKFDFNRGHDFQALVNQVMADVTDPETGVTVAQRARAGIRIGAYDGEKTDPRALAAAETWTCSST